MLGILWTEYVNKDKNLTENKKDTSAQNRKETLEVNWINKEEIVLGEFNTSRIGVGKMDRRKQQVTKFCKWWPEQGLEGIAKSKTY